MDRFLQKPIQGVQEAFNDNRDQFTVNSSNRQLNPSLTGDIGSMERSEFVIDSSTQSSSSKFAVSERDSTLMEDVDVSDTERLGNTATFKDEVAPNIPSIYGKVKKDAEFEKLLGVSKPTTIEIRAPGGIRIKGCGTGKRLIGVGERVIQDAKNKMKCKFYGQLTTHDSRNCPKKKEVTQEQLYICYFTRVIL